MSQRAEEAMSMHCGKEDKAIHPSIHSLTPPLPSLSTAGAPGPGSAFRATTLQFDERRSQRTRRSP